MKIEYELEKSELKKSINEFLYSNFIRGIFSYSIFSLILAYVFSVNENKEIYWTSFLIYCPILFLLFSAVFLLIPYIISVVGLRKVKSKILHSISDEKIITTNLESFKQTEFYWNQVKKVVENKEYYALVFRNRSYIPIPKKIINLEELSELNSKIKFEPQKGIPNWVYFTSFIPNLGFLAGIVFLFIGIKNNVKKNILWGVFGILFTPLFWFIFISIFENTEMSKKSSIQMSKHQLNQIVKDLTYYKSKNKTFPDILGQLKSQNNFLNDTDYLSIRSLPWEKLKPEKLYYKKTSDSTYILKSKGIDRIPNTKDDIIPDL